MPKIPQIRTTCISRAGQGNKPLKFNSPTYSLAVTTSVNLCGMHWRNKLRPLGEAWSRTQIDINIKSICAIRSWEWIYNIDLWGKPLDKRDSTFPPFFGTTYENKYHTVKHTQFPS